MRSFILSISFVLLSMVAVAQPQPQPHRGGGMPYGKGFAEFQSRQIEKVLNLEGEKLEKFRVIYQEYSDASRSEQPREHHPREGERGGMRAGGAAANGTMSNGTADTLSRGDRRGMGLARHDNSALSDEQIEQDILESFARSKRAIEVKESYYKRFREILSPREISTIYEIERRILERMSSEFERRNNATRESSPRD